MRVIAGPNGSGKSTILRELDPTWIGIYVNAGDLQAQVVSGPVDLQALYCVSPDPQLGARLREALRSSPLLRRAGLNEVAGHVQLSGATLVIERQLVNAYVAAVLADFIRRELLTAGESFTFETVMSSPDKVDFMRRRARRGIAPISIS